MVLIRCAREPPSCGRGYRKAIIAGPQLAAAVTASRPRCAAFCKALAMSTSALKLVALAALAAGASGRVSMPSTFTDGLILQTNNEYGTRGFLNGFAAPFEKVAISGSGSYAVTADAEGAWSVMINPHGSSTAPSMTLTVLGESGPALSASGCMFGDVFVCGGGADMLAPMSAIANGERLLVLLIVMLLLLTVLVLTPYSPAASAEIATAADYPLMRLFVAAPTAAAAPARNVSGHWEKLTPASVASFSALCYITARQIGVQGNVVRAAATCS